MSLKNRDNKNRWRNKTVAFRVSPEEDEQIEAAVRLSGLTSLPPFWTNCGGSGTGLAWTMNYWTPFR